MKSSRLLLFLLLCLSATAAWGQMETYEKFAARENLEVAYVTDYRLDSANAVDVILIQSQDSATWMALMHEFSSEEDIKVLDICWGSKAFVTFRADRQDPTRALKTVWTKTESSCLVLIDLRIHSLCIFYITDYEHQMRPIFEYSVRKLKERAEQDSLTPPAKSDTTAAH